MKGMNPPSRYKQRFNRWFIAIDSGVFLRWQRKHCRATTCSGFSILGWGTDMSTAAQSNRNTVTLRTLTPVDDYASGVKEHRSRFRLKPQEQRI
eukprot:644759-Rhodomonas_salina.1